MINNIIMGEDHKYLADCFMELKSKQTDPVGTKDTLDTITRIIKRNFNIDVKLSIIDTLSDLNFFGFNIYPNNNTLNEIIGYTMLDPDHCSIESPIETIKNIWKNCDCWVIEIDAKILYDLSRRFTPEEIVLVLLHEIENNIYCTMRVEKVYEDIKMVCLSVDCKLRHVMKSDLVKKLYALPFVHALEFKCFESNIREDSVLSSNEVIANAYRNMLTKMITYYGNSLIDRECSELDQEVRSMTVFVFEAINDTKYNLWKIKKNTEELLIAEKSPYVKHVLCDAMKVLAAYPSEDKDDLPYILESAGLGKLPEKAVKVREDMAIDAAYKRIQAIKESYESELLDKLGKCKRVTQEDIDVLRLEVQKISSVDDKIYYMEKVYNKLELVEYALSLIGDAETKGRVKDSQDKLLKQKEQLLMIRDTIINFKIAPKRYGLFVKYPEGYEG